jgi:septum formation protein
MTSPPTPRLILASGSPRRPALLEQIGLQFDVVVTNVDESVQPGESPQAYVERLARAKAQAAYTTDCVVLGADTTVAVDDEILGKPCGLTEGVAMLARLSGRAHEVHTGIAVYDGERLESRVVTTTVYFRRISEAEAQRYWYTGEPADKAGGYGIQGIGGIFTERLEGSYSAVVGLPLEQTEQLLRMLDIDTWSTRIDGRRTPH